MGSCEGLAGADSLDSRRTRRRGYTGPENFSARRQSLEEATPSKSRPEAHQQQHWKLRRSPPSEDYFLGS
jgi:hypothetical protein